jgi:PQQ-like domain
MIRVSIGGPFRNSWPGTSQGAPGRTGLSHLAGVLSLEVDGIDVTGGRAEGPALASLEGLLAAVAHLVGGGRQAVVPFRDGEVLLLLRRPAADVLVSLVDLGPPARVPVLGLSVDLGALAAAALEASAELCRTLRRLGPSAAERPARRLEALAARVERARPARTALATNPIEGPARAASPDRGTVVVEVELGESDAGVPTGAPDFAALLVPGCVRVRAAGRRLLEVAAFPALTLRDVVGGLEASALALGRGERESEFALGGTGRGADMGLRLDLRAGLIHGPMGEARGTPLELATAVVEAVEGLATFLGLPFRGHPALDELRSAATSARDHLAELAAGDAAHHPLPRPPRNTPGPSPRPLAPGELRRVAFRTTLRAEVGEPVGLGLLAGSRPVAAGREAVIGLDPVRGRVAWRVPGGTGCLAAGRLLLVRRGETLVAHERQTGAVRWTLPLLGASPIGAAGGPRGPLFIASPNALVGLDPATGAVRFRLELPGARGLALARLGEVAYGASSSGVLYAVTPDGRLAWRLRAPGPALAPPLLLGRWLASLHAAGPGAALLLVDPMSGGRHRELELDVVPAGAPERRGAGLALAGTVGGDAVLFLVDASGGRERRVEVELPLSGAPRLAASGTHVVAGDAAGALAMVDGRGRLSWARPAGAAGEAGGAAPWLGHGVVMAAVAEGLAVLDAATGRSLALASGLSPVRLAVGHSLSVVALEGDGRVTALALSGHLSVVA